VVYLYALQEFNKIFVQSDDALEVYNLDLMTRVALGTGRPQDLDASRERLGDQNAAIVLARMVKVSGRNISKSNHCPAGLWQVTVISSLSHVCHEELHAGDVACAGDCDDRSQREPSTEYYHFPSFLPVIWGGKHNSTPPLRRCLVADIIH
jgi:hypothetical protein